MKLVIQQGPEAGREISLERGLLVIGRGQDSDLVLQDTRASRHHAELRRFGDQWLVVDLGSTNGTFVGSVRLPPNEARPLLPGAQVTIGATSFALELERVAELPPSPAEAALEVPTEVRAIGAGWSAAAWLARALVAAGGAALIAGSLADWLRIQVTVPLLGTVVDKTLTGADSGQAYLFLAVAGVALLLIVLDVASARWSLAAGLGQALVSLAAGAATALDAYRYYRLGEEQRLFGFSLIDLFQQYASRVVKVSLQPGFYLAVAGLAAIILGGVLRAIVATLQPSD
jgi:hypothetical protein